MGAVEDCDAFGKRPLQQSWKAAHDLYISCLQVSVDRSTGYSNLTMQQANGLWRVQECEDYAAEHENHQRDWDYLWYLEEVHACSGWCSRDQQLWTFNSAKDSCSIAASQVFSGKVNRVSRQIIRYTAFVLVGASIFLIICGPFLQK